MADVPFSEFGKGSMFRLRSKVKGTIAAGVTGNILTLTAPAFQIAKLTVLACSSTTNQPGISVTSDGNTILNGTLDAPTASVVGDFFVNSHFSSSVSQDSRSKIAVDEIVGEVIVINKNAGNTTQAIEYSVEYGVMQ